MDSSPSFKLKRVNPSYHMESSFQINCKGDRRKESSKMMKHFYRDEYETRKEKDCIGIGKDMRNSYRKAQNLAKFNAIPRWKYQRKNNIKVRTNCMVMNSRGSDVDVTIHNREVKNNSIVTDSRNSDRDMTVRKRELRTNSIVMGSRSNNDGDIVINSSKYKKEETIQEIMEELMFHRRLLESYQKQKKKPNNEKEESTTKGQCIYKKIELFLDSCEEVMKKTQLFDESEKQCNGVNIDKNENPSRKEIKWRSCLILDTNKKKEGRFDIDNATCLSTSWKSRSSQQQSQLVRPIKSSMTTTAQAKKEVQFDLSSTTWHEVNYNDDGTARVSAQSDVSNKNETKYCNVGILRNSRIYRRSLSNKSLENTQF
ncbi:predicted protein [Chaetoceros tenuissimus]|uniref:Uncharacterized protein n=1 Tax=Chaetoceros tenuissimus TaxID=426638 RepID=A0AAD3CJ49_9STRA|nr:predicted protein [Chaetoceros tenuissimus]